MTPTKLYQIAGRSYAVAVVLFAVALVSGTASGEITAGHLWLGILCFALPCGFFSYLLLRVFRQPRNLPIRMFVIIACYTGVVLFFSFEIGLLLAAPLVLAAFAAERDKHGRYAAGQGADAGESRVG